MMNKKEFKENFIYAIKKTLPALDELSQLNFIVNPVFDHKKYNSTDDVVRLWALKDIDFDQVFSFEETLSILTVVAPKFPLWIQLNRNSELEKHTIEVTFSMRYRNPSQLRNQDQGFPPFKIYELS